MRSEKRLRPDLEAPREARIFLERTLRGHVVGRSLETLSLLVSELVTNAVMHTDTDVTVSIDADPECVTVAVRDGDPDSAGAVIPQRSRRPSDATGRGLQIVDALADQWGVDVLPGAKSVWFEVRVTSPARVEPAPG
jgi:anti-sigma regulatory factor (Ser/Thr protein kinase)